MQNTDFLDIGIGIVSDEVIVGTIDTAQVRDYTAIGTPVNLAASFKSVPRRRTDHCRREHLPGGAGDGRRV